MTKRQRRWAAVGSAKEWRLDAFRFSMALMAGVIVGRLFVLQVIDYGVYEAIASGQHEIFRELYPERGEILFHDYKDGNVVPAATNQQLTFVYADPRHIEDADAAAEAIGGILGYDEEGVDRLENRLKRKEDQFEPVEHRVDDETFARIEALELDGIEFVRETTRLYPEGRLGGHVLGFLGSDAEGTLAGKYGIEGYFNTILTGMPGFLRSEKDISGRLIAIGDRSIKPAVDGADIVLTLDRTIQYIACEALDNAVALHQADGGSVIILDPGSGAVLAMCGAPDFDPNDFRSVPSISVFNNPAIFEAYEPGSIFKPVTIAAALDAGAITPSTTFEDTGSLMIDDWPKPIMNAEGKIYGVVDMTTSLEQSINTGMIFAMRQTGQEKFTNYVENFGFGTRTGIELETEVAGDTRTLDMGPEIYAATASFGQGITVTPLQMVAAYGAIANGGILKQPYIVDEIRHSDGTVEKHEPVDVRRVIESKTARLLGAMLVSVIEHGHGKQAGVEGYYIGGKTGTAQVASSNGTGYDEERTIGSFAGFGPVEDPKFAMIVRIDNPRDVKWAESTAAPLFGEIAEFLLQYLEIPPTRN